LQSPRMTWHITITSIAHLPQYSQLVIRYSWMLPTFTQHAPQRNYCIASLVPSQLFIQLDHMPIACNSNPLCHASTLSSMLSSSYQSQKIQSDNKFTHHLHQLWLEVNNIMRWSLFWLAGSGLWVWGELLGEQTWCQCTVTDFTVLLQSPWCTLSHLCDSLQPAWTSVLVYQYPDFTAVGLMHPWHIAKLHCTKWYGFGGCCWTLYVYMYIL